MMHKRTYTKLSDECAYCNRDTVDDKDHLLLFDREFQPCRWHRHCASRFITENLEYDKNEYEDAHLNYIADNIHLVFREFIKRANEREDKERYHYRQVVITV
jgi:hypothetical protein